MKNIDRNVAENVALVGSYLPRKCGIATFTKDLRDAISSQTMCRRTMVLAMNDVVEGYTYDDEVQFEIRASHQRDYGIAAEMLNINQVDLVVVQHEFGLFGGRDGSYLLDLMRNVRKPILTTLHTVLADPSEGQADVMLELAKASDQLIVMSERAVAILQDVYEIPKPLISFIPHGIPDVPFVDPAYYKDQFGLEGRTVLLSFGLLSRGKGIEVVIKALPKIIAKHPEVTYLVLGATHPHVLSHEGDEYRHSLEKLAADLGVSEHVAFHDRFVTLEELCGYIGASDIYVTPYTNKEQAVSGTLAYALGAGKAVISTPYSYAEEMLADGRGALFPFGDHDRLGTIIVELLEDEVRRNAMRKNAYSMTRSMVWNEVGRKYLELGTEILRERAEHPRPSFYFRGHATSAGRLPEVNLAHLRTLTDDTGMIQHAVYSVPNRSFGYCTDDNARALLAVLMYYDLYRDKSVLPLISTYLSFLHHAFDSKSRRFRNFMGYDRTWLEDVGSEDSHGRAIWSLGLTVARAPDQSTLALATRLFHDGVESASAFTAPRSWAFALVGIHGFLTRFDGDTLARRQRHELSNKLYDRFKANASEDWLWCEDILTYSNAKLPHALILGGRSLADDAMLKQGLDSLDWLVRIQTRDNGKISLVGNRGWMERGGERAIFDQQPVDAMALVEACAAAYIATEDDRWRDEARRAAGWFLGNNDTQSVLYDFKTGGCRDGLEPEGPSFNEGAESTVAWLIAAMTLHELSQDEAIKDGLDSEPPMEAGRRNVDEALNER